MVVKNSPSRILFLVFNSIFLIIIAAITLYPFLYVLSASLTADNYIIQGKINLIPLDMHFSAYKKLLNYTVLWRSYANTIFYTVVGTTINMVLTILGAYVLSRKQFFGRKFFTIFTAITIWFNAGMIPNYLLVDQLGIYNTIWAMLLPMAITTYNMIVMKTFFQQIPESLEEASSIDGCNDVDTLVRIFLPVSVPSLMTIGLFYAVYHWNSFMPALLYLRDKNLWTLQLVLRDLVILGNASEVLDSSEALGREGLKYAAIMIAVLPMLCLYPFIQKFFVKGIMVGAVKG